MPKVKHIIKKIYINIFYELSMRFLIKTIIINKLSCIQLGAGVGTLDPENGDDGFQKVMKRVCINYKPKIHLYEPNPANQSELKKSWSWHSENTKIFQEGVSLSNNFEKLEFYYHPSDRPHYQVCSIQKSHVLKHYFGSSESDLKKFICDCIPLDKLTERMSDEKNSDLFIAIDVEGIDYITIENLLNSVHINKYLLISFEKIHINKDDYKRLMNLAKLKGFISAGFGVDPNYHDELLVKKKFFNKNYLLKILQYYKTYF